MFITVYHSFPIIPIFIFLNSHPGSAFGQPVVIAGLRPAMTMGGLDQHNQCRKGKDIKCESHQQCKDILNGEGECIRERCIIPYCNIDEHCPPGHKCHDRDCVHLGKCRKPNDCGSGFNCDDGFCTTKIEGECREHKDCPNEVPIFFLQIFDNRKTLDITKHFFLNCRLISVPMSILVKKETV